MLPKDYTAFDLSWKTRIKSLAGTLRDGVFPPVCASCRKVGVLICDDCYQQIQWMREPVCPTCGRIVKYKGLSCPICQTRPLPIHRIRAATQFVDPISTIIHKMKYEGLFGLAMPLANLMVEAWPQWQLAVDWIMPIPLHPDREKKRGYNQSALLAKHVSGQLGYPYAPDLLKRIRFTPPQVGLNAAARLTNVQGAFFADSKVLGKHILLIDDVCTTGATMAEAAQALVNAGAVTVSGYCVARAV